MKDPFIPRTERIYENTYLRTQTAQINKESKITAELCIQNIALVSFGAKQFSSKLSCISK
jgi:hypothetical protein